MNTLEAPIHRDVKSTNAFWYLNNRFAVLADAAETENEYGLIYGLIDRTGTPPAHVHDREDEVLYILSGEGKVLVGDQEYVGKAGDLCYLPRGVAHLPLATSEAVEILMLISPANFLGFFQEFMAPATHGGQPEPNEVQIPPAEDMLRAGNHYGLTFLPPAATVASWPIPEIHAEPRHVPAAAGEKLDVMGSHVSVKLDASSTQGLFSIFEIEDLPGASVDAYINRVDSEAFYVIEGEYDLMVEWMNEPAKPGSFIFVPPGVVRGYQNVGHSIGKMLHITARSGKEEYFRQIHATPNMDRAKFREISRRHGIEFVA